MFLLLVANLEKSLLLCPVLWGLAELFWYHIMAE
jgi:hypothetical protein